MRCFTSEMMLSKNVTDFGISGTVTRLALVNYNLRLHLLDLLVMRVLASS